jgi:hypothetical protein
LLFPLFLSFIFRLLLLLQRLLLLQLIPLSCLRGLGFPVSADVVGIILHF